MDASSALSAVNSNNGLQQAAGMMLMKKSINMEAEGMAQVASMMNQQTTVAQSPPNLGNKIDIGA